MIIRRWSKNLPLDLTQQINLKSTDLSLSLGLRASQLAPAVKTLVKQAYPGINPDAVETLALDNFVDALPDSDIRFRVRE